jgi:hypothetical protein
MRSFRRQLWLAVGEGVGGVVDLAHPDRTLRLVPIRDELIARGGVEPRAQIVVEL